MGEIILVRHGQANNRATTEEDYDRLSPLGHEQAGWLGEWLTLHEAPFDHVLSGTMRRHNETAHGAGLPPIEQDKRLNEMDYFALSRDIEITKGLAQPANAEDWADHVQEVMTAWHKAEINGAEPFAAFEHRVRSVLYEAATPGKRTICFTSGGVIGMALRIALDLEPVRLAHVLAPIYNSSLHRFRVRDGAIFLSGFNAIPHLDRPERADARTWI